MKDLLRRKKNNVQKHIRSSTTISRQDLARRLKNKHHGSIEINVVTGELTISVVLNIIEINGTKFI